MVPDKSKLSSPITADSPLQLKLYPSKTFGLNSSTDSNIKQLFKHLISLSPMDKNGSMSGDCDLETTQMETFLSQTFNFQNLPGQYIVHGVKSFELRKSLDSIHPNVVIHFPSKTSETSFAMSAQEIRDWQQSYRVYADKTVEGMTKEFLLQALQGKSECGDEAFRMKFVVRISTCPILMEFDARIIPRELQEEWPNRIKLVSVTGIDFAGRIHDINDILTYVTNWREVYEINAKSALPQVYHGRDFRRQANGPRGKLNIDLLLNDLVRMARLRLQACEEEKVQIVVETGIGLGVFAGRAIEIDETVRALSARAIRQVLEEDGSNYRNIQAVVFALPIFDVDYRHAKRQDTYQAFVDEFDSSKYEGPIPVLIADQDMHRLTVAIARKEFIVSELNPADSHGVFGEYWQNRGPAVEEKLALTTVGLLVQHHIINSYVLKPENYRLM
ncbi:unnamed protein product [Rotaria sp. Silwood2]|nr:unnamed protein product [Rotaria sp. Silwood2]CAF4560775.1 unnamed protein product [Rotaria sp. Silwood2]